MEEGESEVRSLRLKWSIVLRKVVEHGVIRMTELLEQAITKLKALPIDEQDTIATLILEELEAERQWDESFARSPDLLAKLAAEAMAEHRAGKTQEFETEIQNGIIEIPEQYKQELSDGDKIRVSIVTKKLHKRAWSIMDELAQNPISVKNSGKITRDEMHDRSP